MIDQPTVLAPEHVWHINEAARECGIPKDTLRIWERRYGFPKPGRDRTDERVYTAADLEKLKLLRRLIDAGHRPGKIVGLDMDALRTLQAGLRTARRAVAASPHLQPYLDAIDAHDERALARLLASSLQKRGLESFILEEVAPLTFEVGERFMAGQLPVCAEHMVTEVLQNVLRQAIAAIPDKIRQPKVLLTTTPGEEHGLGLLMVHGLLALEGAYCVSLGTETPIQDIALATRVHRADILGLSFSANVPVAQVSTAINSVREVIPESVMLWVGGAGACAVEPLPHAVTRPAGLAALGAELRGWRRERPRPGRSATP